jgi:prophage antirepressor-like protein
MITSLTPFTFGSNDLRVVLIDEEPWFAAKDVCDILEIADTRQAVERLDEDEKGRYSIPTPGGNQELWCVNEPGLFSLVLSSKKPDAKPFKRWITHEVIPSIRRTGSYSIQPKSIEDLIIMSAQSMKEMRQQINGQAVLIDNHTKQLETIKETIVVQPEQWRYEINRMIESIGKAMGNKYLECKSESYKALETRGHCDLEERLKNLKNRLRDSGSSKTKVNQANKLDVIESDPKLCEIYLTIVKEMYIKHIA